MAQATFVPPAPDRVLECMDAWEKFYHADSPDPLVQLAMVHAQFELIHPFLDGNGRLGRILIPLFLTEKGVLEQPMFYLSAYLEQKRDVYMERLRELSHRPDGQARWIEFFLQAIAAQAAANTRTARSIVDLYQAKKVQVVELTRSPWAVTVLDHLFQQPVFPASALTQKKNGPSRQTLTILLAKLKKAKILKTVHPARGRRAEVLAFPELLDLCENRKVV
jgi:Fic family protein